MWKPSDPLLRISCLLLPLSVPTSTRLKSLCYYRYRFESEEVGYRMKLPTILTGCILVLLLPCVASLAQKSAQKQPKSSIITTSSMSRRHALQSYASATAAATLALITLQPEPCVAASLAPADLLTQLQRVPTFCIVNSETGAAYMVVKRNEGMAVGYAFTTFQGALAVLGDAVKAAEKGGYADIWKNATITTIPADIAMRLALKQTTRSSQKDQSLGTLVNLIPGADDREDALQLGDKKFNDQGKVPLFYLKELKLSDGSTPAYFKKQDLVEEWKKQYPSLNPPRIKLLDLVETFQYTLRNRSDELPANLLIVPNEEAVEAAKELKNRGLAPYKVDRMVV